MRVVAWREVRTSGGVPLVVYVLLADNDAMCVHRYGDFRQLLTRFVSRLFYDRKREPPRFPQRRVFRKLLPVAMGGTGTFTSGGGVDAEFIETRAAGLEAWLQSVVDFCHEQPSGCPPDVRLALRAFLSPLVVLEAGAADPFRTASGRDMRLSALARDENLSFAVSRAVEVFCVSLLDPTSAAAAAAVAAAGGDPPTPTPPSP